MRIWHWLTGRQQLRDQFAGQAMLALLTRVNEPEDCDEQKVAHDAYAFADAMLAARSTGR